MNLKDNKEKTLSSFIIETITKLAFLPMSGVIFLLVSIFTFNREDFIARDKYKK